MAYQATSTLPRVVSTKKTRRQRDGFRRLSSSNHRIEHAQSALDRIGSMFDHKRPFLRMDNGTN
jgi:hypothetical protein